MTSLGHSGQIMKVEYELGHLSLSQRIKDDASSNEKANCIEIKKGKNLKEAKVYNVTERLNII